MKKVLMIFMLAALVIGVFPIEKADAATNRIDLYLYQGTKEVSTLTGVTNTAGRRVHISFMPNDYGSSNMYYYTVKRNNVVIDRIGVTKASGYSKFFSSLGTYTFKVECYPPIGVTKLTCSGQGTVQLR